LGRTLITTLGFFCIIAALACLIAVPFALHLEGWNAAIFFLLAMWFLLWSAGKIFMG